MHEWQIFYRMVALHLESSPVLGVRMYRDLFDVVYHTSVFDEVNN